jgi:hypothetical protein
VGQHRLLTKVKVGSVATYNIQVENDLPMIGNVSADAGNLSDTSRRKTDRDNKTVTSKETFSPESAGRMKPRAASTSTIAQGNMIVKT